MNQYKSPYFTLFSAISDTLEVLEALIEEESNEKIKSALLKECSRLKKVQLTAEEEIISGDPQ